MADCRREQPLEDPLASGMSLDEETDDRPDVFIGHSLVGDAPESLYVGRGAIEHQAVGSPPRYAKSPTCCPDCTRPFRARFRLGPSDRCGRSRMSRQTMHQQLLGPPRDSNSCSRSGHRALSTTAISSSSPFCTRQFCTDILPAQYGGIPTQPKLMTSSCSDPVSFPRPGREEAR